MNPNQILPLMLLASGLVNNATASIAALDTLRNGVQFREASFFVNLGATDIALTALKVQECDTISGSYTDITATVFGAAGPTLPSATDDNKMYHITVTGRKRFLKLIITVGTGSTGANLTVFCVLSTPVAASLTDLLTAARGLTNQEVIA